MKKFSCVLLIIITITFSSCTHIGKRFESPRVNLVNVQVQKIGTFETILNITFRIFNHNRFPLHIKGMDCDLKFNGSRVASGVSSDKIEILPFNTTTSTMTVYSSLMDVARGILKFADKERVEYEVIGRIHLRDPFLFTSALSFKARGEISFQHHLDG